MCGIRRGGGGIVFSYMQRRCTYRKHVEATSARRGDVIRGKQVQRKPSPTTATAACPWQLRVPTWKV